MITGFPSPAQGYEEKIIDLNELLVRHPAATVFMRIESSRYTRAGIYPGDLLVVDRSLDPRNAAIVVRECEGRFMLGTAESVAEGAIVCGVVTHVIHTVRRNSRIQGREDSGRGRFRERGGEEGRGSFRGLEDSGRGGFREREGQEGLGCFLEREDSGRGGFCERGGEEGRGSFQEREDRGRFSDRSVNKGLKSFQGLEGAHDSAC